MTETQRNRLRLWRRWQITFDHFHYSAPMQRVHQALVVHPVPWTTRALAKYTNLPQTSVRRQLRQLTEVNVRLVEGGFQITELGEALNWTMHVELEKFVRGGHKLNLELLGVHEKVPNFSNLPDIDYEWLRNHVWLPIIPGSDIDDA